MSYSLFRVFVCDPALFPHMAGKQKSGPKSAFLSLRDKRRASVRSIAQM